jgi:hypothetical protein
MNLQKWHLQHAENYDEEDEDRKIQILGGCVLATAWLPEKESKKQDPPAEGRQMKKTAGLVRRRLERIGFVRVPHKAAVVQGTWMGARLRANTSREPAWSRYCYLLAPAEP